jgi:hypothetical protein
VLCWKVLTFLANSFIISMVSVVRNACVRMKCFKLYFVKKAFIFNFKIFEANYFLVLFMNNIC